MEISFYVALSIPTANKSDLSFPFLCLNRYILVESGKEFCRPT